MKILCLAFALTLISQSLHGQKLAASRTAWKPENEVQCTAELVRLSFQRDFEEVVLIHYGKNSPAELHQLVTHQMEDASESTGYMQALAAALSQAMKARRCDQSCASQIKPLLDDFTEMGKTVISLNQEQIAPELLPQETARFQDRVKSSGRYIRAIHLKAPTS